MSKTPRTSIAFEEAYNQNLPEYGEGWNGFAEDVQKAMEKLETELMEAMEIVEAVANGVVDDSDSYVNYQLEVKYIEAACDLCEKFKKNNNG